MGLIASQAFNAFYQFFDGFAYLVLSAIGLAVIFGMMGIINMAHGQLIMLGAYITTFLARAGVPLFPLAMLLGAACVGVWGLILERLVVCRFYKRKLDSVVATWGIGLIMTQGILILFGPNIEGLSTPFGSFTVGGESYSVYRMVLGVCAVVMLVIMYCVFMYTRFGLHARATMQNAEVARSLGVNTSRMYTLTFAFGAAMAGVTGGLYAPTTTIAPFFGDAFILESFATVIMGGANPLTGTLLAGGVLGFFYSLLSGLWSTFAGRLGLLLAMMIVIRFLPRGLSGVSLHLGRFRLGGD